MRGGRVYAAREARPESLEDGLRTELGDDARRVLVGTIDDAPVGYAAAHTEVLRDGMRLGVISDIYVEPEARGVGVGEALMDTLLEWFDTQRCDGIDAIALPGDRETKNFFEGAGFSARLLLMHHRSHD